MKIISILFLTLFASNVYSNVYLRLCYDNTRTTGVSYSFQSCINYNFDSIKRETGALNFYCSNLGNRVSYSFTNCIERNFEKVENKIGINLNYCMNFDRDKLSYSYTNCIRRNFSKIERELNESDK